MGGHLSHHVSLKPYSINIMFFIEQLLHIIPKVMGKVESTNKVIEEILTKKVREHHRD
jgi:hypothetical protein